MRFSRLSVAAFHSNPVRPSHHGVPQRSAVAAMGIPGVLLASLVACKSGVKRVYFVDVPIYGALMLELHSQDGESTVNIADLHKNSECWS